MVSTAGPAAAADGTFSVSIGPGTTPILSGAQSGFTVSYACSGVAGGMCETPTLTLSGTCTHPSGYVDCYNGYAITPSADFVGSGPSLRTLQAGESGTFSVTVNTNNFSTPDGTQLVLSVSGTANGVPYPAASSPAVTINATPRFSADKQVTPTNVAVGGTATYTVNYSSTEGGNAPEGTVGIQPASWSVVDTLPVGAVFVSATNSGTYDSGAGTVTWAPAPTYFAGGTSGQVMMTVLFPEGTFSAGQSIVNNAAVTGTAYGSATSVTLPVQRLHVLGAPDFGYIVTKQAYSSIARANPTAYNAYATRGDVVLWNPVATNTSNVAVDMTMSDTLQAGVTVKQIQWYGSRLTVTYADTTTDTFTNSGAPTSTVDTTFDPTKTVTAWTIAYDAAPPNGFIQAFAYGPVGLSNEATVQNCVTTTGVAGGQSVWSSSPTGAACTGFVIIAPLPIPAASAYIDFPVIALPGTEAGWNVRISNVATVSGDAAIDGLATITEPSARIALNAGHTYVPNSLDCEVDGSCIVTLAAGPAGSQYLTVRFPDATLPPGHTALLLHFRTAIAPDFAGTQLTLDTLFGDLDHPFLVPYVCCEYPNRVGHQLDTGDANGNGNTAEYLAFAPTGKQVQVSGTLAGTKRVQGNRDAALVTVPAVGNADPGGTADYQLRLVNTGAQPAANIVVYDVLPGVGDTGVAGSQTGTARGSQFAVGLRAAVTNTSGTAVIAYSTSTNPCRPEVGVEVGTGGCVDDWTTTLADPAAVRAIRIVYTGTVLAEGEAVTATIPGQLAGDAPVGQIAYNSFAYAATINGASLVAEPARVGVQAVKSAVTIATAVQTLPGDDVASTPNVLLGAPVQWTYTVTNSGTTTLTAVTVTDASVPSTSIDCGDGSNVVASLAPGAVVVCTATGTALLGPVTHIGAVAGDSVYGVVSATDPAIYVGVQVGLELKKLTQTLDVASADDAPTIVAGSPVLWTYVLTNTGSTALSAVTVTDADLLAPAVVDCGSGSAVIDSLAPSASVSCTTTGVAIDGPYMNTGSASATGPTTVGVDGSTKVQRPTASDISYYTGITPAVTIVKTVNGADANTPAAGPTLVAGSAVTFAYLVTNAGNTNLAITVEDDVLGSILCPVTTLSPGATVTCTAVSVAVADAYTNTGTVVGTVSGVQVIDVKGASIDATVTSSDVAFYKGILAVTTTPTSSAPSNPPVSNVPTSLPPASGAATGSGGRLSSTGVAPGAPLVIGGLCLALGLMLLTLVARRPRHRSH